MEDLEESGYVGLTIDSIEFEVAALYEDLLNFECGHPMTRCDTESDEIGNEG